MEHAGPRSNAASEARHERLGGARAEFVANLGRRVAELREMVRRIEADGDAPRLVEELKRRLHSLGAGARLLRFVRVSERLAEGESQLAAANGAPLSGEAAAALRKLLEELPALAWGQSAMGEPAPAPRAAAPLEKASAPPRARAAADPPNARSASARPEATGAAASQGQATTWIAGVSNGRALAPEPLSLDDEEERASSARGVEQAPPAEAPEAASAASIDAPITVLVVGAAPLAEAFDSASADVGPSFEVERTDDVETAIDLARAFAPDLVLLDADMPGARGLAEALAADPLTDLVPVVAVGRFARPEDAAPYVALGAARACRSPCRRTRPARRRGSSGGLRARRSLARRARAVRGRQPRRARGRASPRSCAAASATPPSRGAAGRTWISATARRSSRRSGARWRASAIS